MESEKKISKKCVNMIITFFNWLNFKITVLSLWLKLIWNQILFIICVCNLLVIKIFFMLLSMKLVAKKYDLPDVVNTWKMLY